MNINKKKLRKKLVNNIHFSTTDELLSNLPDVQVLVSQALFLSSAALFISKVVPEKYERDTKSARPIRRHLAVRLRSPSTVGPEFADLAGS